MKTITCEQCGKVIEGYTDDHILQLMKQHHFKHEREEAKLEEVKDGNVQED